MATTAENFAGNPENPARQRQRLPHIPLNVSLVTATSRVPFGRLLAGMKAVQPRSNGYNMIEQKCGETSDGVTVGQDRNAGTAVYIAFG